MPFLKFKVNWLTKTNDWIIKVHNMINELGLSYTVININIMKYYLNAIRQQIIENLNELCMIKNSTILLFYQKLVNLAQGHPTLTY
jgi:hypothetical protein